LDFHHKLTAVGIFGVGIVGPIFGMLDYLYYPTPGNLTSFILGTVYAVCVLIALIAYLDEAHTVNKLQLAVKQLKQSMENLQEKVEKIETRLGADRDRILNAIALFLNRSLKRLYTLLESSIALFLNRSLKRLYTLLESSYRCHFPSGFEM